MGLLRGLWSLSKLVPLTIRRVLFVAFLSHCKEAFTARSWYVSINFFARWRGVLLKILFFALCTEQCTYRRGNKFKYSTGLQWTTNNDILSNLLNTLTFMLCYQIKTKFPHLRNVQMPYLWCKGHYFCHRRPPNYKGLMWTTLYVNASLLVVWIRHF